MREEIDPNPCITQRVGHSPHWIQANLAGRAKKRPTSGRLIEVNEDGHIVLDIGGRKVNVWNHTPERLSQIARRCDGLVKYQPEFHLLWIPQRADGGPKSACCVAKDSEDHGPCRFHPPGTIFGELFN